MTTNNQSHQSDPPDVTQPEDQILPPGRQTDNVEKLGHKRENPGPAPEYLGDDPTAGTMPPRP